MTHKQVEGKVVELNGHLVKVGKFHEERMKLKGNTVSETYKAKVKHLT